ncbi:MAG: NAD-dependent epimerase/dehydratase family protein, partial [Bacteroidetes bacterium]|nr:NAD-dependent epimerase/dehydratase family protein [Bacteroidota bacterium]
IGMNESTFLPRIILSALREKSIKIFGNGGRLQNYIHVSDVAELFLRAAQQHTNNTYLAVAERSYSNFELASLVKKELLDVEISFVGEDSSCSFLYDGKFSYGSLQYKPQKSIHEGIIELIKWQQKKF